MSSKSLEFISLYMDGNIEKAENIFSYNYSLEGWEFTLRNYVDALFWGEHRELFLQGIALKEQLPLSFKTFAERVSLDCLAVSLRYLPQKDTYKYLPKDAVSQTLLKLYEGIEFNKECLPNSLLNWYEKQWRMICGIKKMEKAHPKYWNLFAANTQAPLLPLTTPFIDLSLPKVFTFEHPSQFYHALSNPDMVRLFCEPNAYFFLYGIHPTLQISQQPGIPNLPFKEKDYNSIHKWCCEKRACFNLERWQGKGVFSTLLNHTFDERSDPFKESCKPIFIEKGLSYWENKALQKLPAYKIDPKVHSRKRIAHIVPRLGDASSYAPSKILETIVMRHDQ